jgi:hypothetical protein
VVELIGADPDQLDRTAEHLERTAQRIGSIHPDVARALATSPWDGPDADDYRDLWRTRGRLILDHTVDLLNTAATTLHRNAEDQRHTSAADTAWTGGPGPGGPGGPAGPGADRARLAAELDELRRRGVPPAQYRDKLQEYWLSPAYEKAGIDPAAWRPAAGAEANRANIENVYRYYGQLYLDHPELQWAGMANMIGPSFAAGFQDLAAMRSWARGVADRIDQLPEPVRANLPPEVRRLRDLANATDEELRYYETTLLTMQKDIFRDQATAHEAYLAGGMPAIEELRRADLIDPATVEGWRLIDRGKATGDPTLVARGNTILLHREQWHVIRDSYDAMRNHPVTGQPMTYAMGAIGKPSIEGARPYGAVSPFEVHVPTPGPERLGIPGVSIDNPAQGTVTLRTPLPDGNISEVNNRWSLIERDTMPAYQRLLAEDPGRARAIIGSSIRDRIDGNRLQPRIPDLVDQFTDWSVRVEQ